MSEQKKGNGGLVFMFIVFAVVVNLHTCQIDELKKRVKTLEVQSHPQQVEK